MRLRILTACVVRDHEQTANVVADLGLSGPTEMLLADQNRPAGGWLRLWKETAARRTVKLNSLPVGNDVARFLECDTLDGLKRRRRAGPIR